MDFKVTYSSYLEKVNKALDSFVEEKESPEKSIYGAMRYSLMAGGKRIRPVLALAVNDLLGAADSLVMPYACGLEMIHTYSLIHDDLPAMDNDDYRRGRLTNHKVFGEAEAILAGDALLTYAFELMLRDVTCEGPHELLVNKSKAAALIAFASGTRGMIGGQVVDMESEGKQIDASLLEYMHKCKTGALIKASVLAPAVLNGLAEEGCSCLEKYADNIGLAFQIKDDILDFDGSFEALGKAVGSDAGNKKSTFVTLYGIDESKHMIESVTAEAIEALGVFGGKAEFLIQLAEYLARRDR